MAERVKDKNYRWNFTVNLLDGSTYWFGNSFIASSTILPLFVSKLTPSLLPIGLVSVISSAGWFLPQMFSARITERYSRMKTISIGWGIFLERLSVWVMVISAIIARNSPDLALILFLLCLAWFMIGAGVIAPAWMSLMAKIFEPRKRGSFFGITMFIGSAMGLFGSAASAWLLDNIEFPDSFIYLFGVAAVFMTISWIFLALTREPKTRSPILRQDWKTYWKDLANILREDRNFRRFVISNIIVTIGSMGFGFVTISAIQRYQVSDAVVGLYTLSMLIGQMLGYLVLGKMADKFGHKLSLQIGVFSIFLAFFLAVIMPSSIFYFLIFGLLGINLSSGIVSGMLVVWEFCDIQKVPTYSGLANTSRGIINLAVPLVAAQLASFSFNLLFLLCTILSLLGLLMLIFWVREPRWQSDMALEKS